MKRHSGQLEEVGLQFFGKVTASVSHEIRNVFAIINENVGLLQDLSLLAEKGRAFDTARVKALAEKMKAQIRRGDEIIENMNRFAHSVDETVKRVDLGETLDLAIKLARRFAAMRKVSLELKPASAKVRITTYPFYLQNLIWQCLDLATAICGEDKTISVVVQEAEKGARIRYLLGEGFKEMPLNSLPTQSNEVLIEMLMAQISFDIHVGEIALSLPSDVSD